MEQRCKYHALWPTIIKVNQGTRGQHVLHTLSSSSDILMVTSSGGVCLDS